jgi:gentisate 1,2-dioxygenase
LTEIGELMPLQPHPTALPHRWRWQNLLPLAERGRQARVALPACIYERH